MKLNLVIAGEAGQGLNTLNYILTKTFFRQGFNLYASKDYMSRVRGGHNFMSIRIGDEEITGPTTDEDILVALNQESVERHSKNVTDNGLIIYDGELADSRAINLPAAEIADQLGNTKVANTVFVGGLLKLIGLDLELAREVLAEHFTKQQIRELNQKALEKGYQAVSVQLELPAVTQTDEEILIDGNQAVGMGAVMGGVKFYSAYPMTPATGIMNYIAKRQNELEIAVEQAEDEIAAINMALGASYSGVRAMTATSGGGFSLMNEGLGLAGIAEIPLVIAEVQRPGPATGLPTRTEQGDLSFVINASQGDFPLLVLAPRDNEDAFYQTVRAFNLAEKYQIPVIILSDQFLADSKQNISEFDLESLEIEDHYLADDEEVSDYQRYQFSSNGISPLAYPGQFEDQVVVIDSDEHDQSGHIIEDSTTRTKMVDKRADKLATLIEEDLQEPEYEGAEEIDYLLVSWGSTYGPLQEAKELLAVDDVAVGLLSFSDVWPLPTTELQKRAKDAVVIVVENNATGQLARLIRSETELEIKAEILQYDGRPFTGRKLYQSIKEEVSR
ncbi:MAG: 2-oxoacid:acceptor oxidoreductase subunit alpha [Bacillota bacterium]